MKAVAKRVPIFVDSEPQHSASEECLVAFVGRKSVGPCHRRRSSSLDNENGIHTNRKSLVVKVPSGRVVGTWLSNVLLNLLSFVMAVIRLLLIHSSVYDFVFLVVLMPANFYLIYLNVF